MNLRRTRAAAIAAVLGVLIGACSENEPTTDSTAAVTTAADPGATTVPGSTTAPDTTGGSESTDDPGATTSAPPTTGGSDDAATAFGLDYIGGTPGPASGTPYRIGFAHSGDFFPEGDIAADAAVQFINSELGGVGGRPLELVRCNIVTAADSSACGAQFANDPQIDLVIGGLVLDAPGDLYGALQGTAAAIIAAPLDVSDYISPFGVSYNTGALGAGIGGAVFVNEEIRPQTVALVVTDDVAGRGGASVLTPIVEGAGIELKQVFVPPTATAPEIAAALQATGAATADVVTVGLFEQGCIAAYDALASLGIEPEVVTTSVCWGNAMQEHLRSVGAPYAFPDNWNFAWFGFNPFITDLEPSVAAYLAKIDQYGGADVKYSVGAPIVFDAVMTAAKIINTVGVDQASYDTLDAGVRGFTGPSIIQAGTQECGIPPYISICASLVGVHKFLDGEWITRRSGSDGTAIDLSPYTRPES